MYFYGLFSAFCHYVEKCQSFLEVEKTYSNFCTKPIYLFPACPEDLILGCCIVKTSFCMFTLRSSFLCRIFIWSKISFVPWSHFRWMLSYFLAHHGWWQWINFVLFPHSVTSELQLIIHFSNRCLSTLLAQLPR